MLTILLWLLSFSLIYFSLRKTEHWVCSYTSIIDNVARFSFAIMVGLSFWLSSVYLFWLMGFQLNVGMIADGSMSEYWWLPLASVLLTMLNYFASKPKKKGFKSE